MMYEFYWTCCQRALSVPLNQLRPVNSVYKPMAPASSTSNAYSAVDVLRAVESAARGDIEWPVTTVWKIRARRANKSSLERHFDLAAGRTPRYADVVIVLRDRKSEQNCGDDVSMLHDIMRCLSRPFASTEVCHVESLEDAERCAIYISPRSETVVLLAPRHTLLVDQTLELLQDRGVVPKVVTLS